MANYFVKKKLFYQKKNFTEKMYTNMKKKMLLKMAGYILQRPTRNSEVIPIERGSIITYRRNL